MNDATMTEDQLAIREFEANEARCEKLVKAYRLDAGDHLQWLSEDTDAKGVGVAYSATPVAGVIMRSMQESIDNAAPGGHAGPLPWTMLVRANLISKAVSELEEVMHKHCDIFSQSEDVLMLDAAFVSSCAHGLNIAMLRDIVRKGAKSMVADGQAQDETAERMQGEAQIMAAALRGVETAASAFAVGEKMRAGEAITTTRANGVRSAIFPVDKNEDPEVMRAMVRGALNLDGGQSS